MKSIKKPHPGHPEPPPSPRQLAWRRFYSLSITFGIIFAIIGAAVVLSLYGNDIVRVLRGTPPIKLATGKEIEFREPKLNPAAPPESAPEAMLWIPGGEFYMGIDAENFPGPHGVLDAAEIHLVYVNGFWLDKTEVTNEEFARFIKATRYVTDAEKQPSAKEFPDVPPDKLKPFSIVFRKPARHEFIDLRNHMSWWEDKAGACWKHPEGAGSTIERREKHPVVHVSYNDALAYCLWAKKRLPTEAEWEFAARGGLDRKLYAWGDELKPDGKWMANIWQGQFPSQNSKEDNFEGAAPVGSFPPNGYGLHDMSGNVWEWCADWYRDDYYQESADMDPMKAVRNPQGPISGFDWQERGVPKRVQRGGSFLCADSYCMRYVVGTRGKGEIGSAANHTGFRCALDPSQTPPPAEPDGFDIQSLILPISIGAIIVLVLGAAYWGVRRYKNSISPLSVR